MDFNDKATVFGMDEVLKSIEESLYVGNLKSLSLFIKDLGSLFTKNLILNYFLFKTTL